MRYQVRQWQLIALNLNTNKNYLYNCKSNPIEIPDEGALARVFRNKMIVLIAAFGCLSMLLSLLVVVAIYCNKELRDTHPSMLVLMMSLAEFITCYNALVYQLNTVKFVCYWGVEKMYVDSLRFWQPDITEEVAIRHLVNSNVMIFCLF